MNHTLENHTCLTPGQTEFTVEVMLQDTKFIYDQKHQYGEPAAYVFTAVPLSQYFYRELETMMEDAKTKVFRDSGPHSNKEPRSGALGKRYELVFNQLFAPKVSGEMIDVHNLPNRNAVIKGHLRDDPTGLIYLQASYVDVLPLPKTQLAC